MTGSYQFLPWTRQGLATQISTPDTLDEELPARASFPVRVTINEGSPVGVDVTVYGPGDIVGVDPRGIVRTDPPRYATNVEPNYMASIEFDRPDFPWMFTPATAGADERLRPWCVLVVVENTDQVSVRFDRMRPLPVVTLDTGELPPLSESWAWAHVQAVTDEPTTAAIVENIRHQPDLNVSRILCPRRLEPNKEYLACLVPAFATGGLAGLGIPDDTDDMAPAWDTQGGEVELPVYYHWEFATGPGGDFESLARKLAPPAQPLAVGTSRMFVGRADPGLPEIEGEEAVFPLEGALVGPLHTGGEALDGLSSEWLAALAAILDGPPGVLESGDPDVAPVAPFLYGSWQAATHVVPDIEPVWMRQLNLDPRYRAVAGLAAQVVRANQEELMHDAWQQVGNLLGANRLLGLARFSREGALRLHRKVFAPMSAEHLFRLAAPLHARVALEQGTVMTRLRASVVPDATADLAFRRMASNGSRVLKRAARFSGGSDRPAIVSGLAVGQLKVDPVEVVPDGISSVGALGLFDMKVPGSTPLDPMDVKGAVSTAILRELKSIGGAVGVPPLPGKVVLRPDLAKSGIVERAHLSAATDATVADPALITSTLLTGLVTAAVENPEADGFVIEVDAGGGSAGGIAPTSSFVAHARGVPRTGPTGPAGPISGRVTPHLLKRKAAIGRLRRAFTAHVATFVEPATQPDPPELELDAVRMQVLARTDPAVAIPARVSSMIRVSTVDARGDSSVVVDAGDLGQLVGSPQLRRPMYEPLAAYAPERLLPGIGSVPTNTVALVKTNPRFVEAFMIGVNTEMARELLWRQYPARRDGSPLRHFWDRTDAAADIPDIPEIRSFEPGRAVGESVIGGADGDVVMLVRGDLFRRYPTAAIYAVRATTEGRLSTLASDHHHPVLRGRIDPDVTFVGFDLGIDEVLADPGFFFVIQQQPTEPRFGFDIPGADQGPPASWRDASWDHVDVAPGSHLTIAGADVTQPANTGEATFVTNSAHLAAIALQQPVRVAIHARDLIGIGGSDA